MLLTVLAFAFVALARYVLAAASLGGAVLKQFALVAVPFLVVAMLSRAVPRPMLYRAGAAFALVVVAGILPFAIADPGALWDHDRVRRADLPDHRLRLAGILVEPGVLDDRFGSYPFLPLVILVWLPLTAWLAWTQWRRGASGSAPRASRLDLRLVLPRARFQNSYLIWPLSALLVAFVLLPRARRFGAKLKTRGRRCRGAGCRRRPG